MRLKIKSTESMPAALALARLLKLTPREALTLLSEPRILPAELDASAAEALRHHGVDATPISVPLTSSRCATHPALTGEAPCEDCRTLVCPLCLPCCRACSARRATATRWKRIRVAVLLTVLVSLGTWGALRQRRLDQRNAWLRPLRVSVVLASAEPIDTGVTTAWTEGLASLDGWFSTEAERLGLPLIDPIHFELAPATVLTEVPSPPGETSGEWIRDSQDAIALRSKLEGIAAQGRAAGNFDVQLLVALRPANGDAHQVEGLGEAGGTIGLVEGTAGDTALTLELVAVAHELLHCLGARDGYDAQGHALPRGMTEPGFAEVMVGEVPLGPNQGRIPKTLSEVRVGEETAREIGWAVGSTLSPGRVAPAPSLLRGTRH